MIAGIISVQLTEDLASLHAALGCALHKLIELVRRSPRGHRRRDKSHLLAPDFMQELETIPGTTTWAAPVCDRLSDDCVLTDCVLTELRKCNDEKGGKQPTLI